MTSAAVVLGSLTIPGCPEQVSRARAYVAALAGPAAETAALLTSETGHECGAAHQFGAGRRTVTIVVIGVPDGLLVEVIDGGSSASGPEVSGDRYAAHGHGLFLVDQLAARWGCLQTPPGRPSGSRSAPGTTRSAPSSRRPSSREPSNRRPIRRGPENPAAPGQRAAGAGQAGPAASGQRRVIDVLAEQHGPAAATLADPPAASAVRTVHANGVNGSRRAADSARGRLAARPGDNGAKNWAAVDASRPARAAPARRCRPGPARLAPGTRGWPR